VADLVLSDVSDATTWSFSDYDVRAVSFRTELDDVASAHAEELATVLPDLATALAWPGALS
jgi:hypothetical protein